MAKLNLTKYLNKTQDSTVSAEEWNSVFSDIQTSVNDTIDIINSTTIPDAGISDVLVDGVSVVKNGIASITMPKEETTEETPKFYINDVAISPVNGVVTLAAGNTYTLRGTLKGVITIGTAVDVSEDTTIILDGIDIIDSTSKNYGIMYAPTSKTLQVIINKNTVNSIECSYKAANSEAQKAGLYSEKNMNVKGDGYLSIVNNGGHGIKASELRIMGNPAIDVTASHDAIHGNSVLDIYGGDFSIDGANDAFGTGDTGVIKVFGGSFRAKNVVENVFDSKVAGYFFVRVPILSDFTTTTNLINNMTNCDPATYFGTGSITCYSDEDMTTDATAITAVDGVYVLTTQYAKVTGYIEGTIQVDNKTSDLSLNNAYIKGSVKYTPDGKKLKITAEKETVNFIVADAVDAVNSNKNVSIEVKSKACLILNSNQGSGLVGYDITLNDSSGVLSIKDCGQYGIYGRTIYIGTQKDVDETKVFDGALMITGNKVCDIYAALRTEGTEGIISVLNSGMLGTLTTENLEAEGYADLNFSPRISYESINGIAVGILE